ncbi:MAG TPA: DUF6166 domain-containing protein [Stellaceae bacterium]|nr:DUF6166 domain-containing protein [Stellaceae bacterium]
MKSYHGRRTRYGCRVRVCEDNQPPRFLDPRLDLCNHSPTGFEWGYPGSGPAQLALAILADFLGDDARAIALHQEFKWDHISPLTGDEFCISGDVLERWCRRRGDTVRTLEDCDQPAAALSGAAHRLCPSCTS